MWSEVVSGSKEIDCSRFRRLRRTVYVIATTRRMRVTNATSPNTTPASGLLFRKVFGAGGAGASWLGVLVGTWGACTVTTVVDSPRVAAGAVVDGSGSKSRLLEVLAVLDAAAEELEKRE